LAQYHSIHNQLKEEIEILNTKKVRFALASIFESSRKHPGKLHSMYYNMPTIRTIKRSSSEIPIGNSSQVNQYDNNYASDYATSENLLLDEAEQLYNRLIEESMNTCTINETETAESPLHSLQPLS
jgi:hypothetical protein